MLLLSSWRLAQEALGTQGRNIGVREGHAGLVESHGGEVLQAEAVLSKAQRREGMGPLPPRKGAANRALAAAQERLWGLWKLSESLFDFLPTQLTSSVI